MIAELIAGRFTPKNQTQMAARATGLGSMAVGQVEPANLELTRAGRRFLLGNSAAITGIAPVAGLPTTAAQWVIWNADGSATYFFEELGMYLTAGTPGAGGILLAAIIQAPVQLGSSVAGALISSASNGGRASKAIVKTAVTITQPTAPNWFPVASNPSPNAVIFPGSTFLERRDLAGAIAVAPGQGLALCVVAPAGTTPLFAPFARHVEVETDLE